MITWDTGWTTKITKNGNRYEKTAYRKGEPLTGKPANSSDAEQGQVRSGPRGDQAGPAACRTRDWVLLWSPRGDVAKKLGGTACAPDVSRAFGIP